MSALSIGEVARRAGIQASAVRYYERIGLLPPPERRGGQRRYEPSVVSALAAIGVAKEAGFSLDEIKQLFNGLGRDVTPSDRWRRFAEGKLRERDALSARIDAMRRLLHHGVECGCLRLEDCELIGYGDPSSKRDTTIEALWPPKPKEFDTATRTSALRASFGT